MTPQTSKGRGRRPSTTRRSGLGAAIARARVRRGWSQGALGKMMGRSARQVARWESGTCEPSIDQLDELAETLCVHMRTLLSHRRARA